jgi:Xaa-Pro aminopeptidase
VEHTPGKELRQRIGRLQHLLQEKNVDGAVIVQNADLFYFTGTAQQACLFVPAEGKPILAVKKSFPRARQESALDEVLPLENIKELPGIISSHGFAGLKALGLELDVLPASLYLKYRKMFAPTEIVDISGLIRTVRMVKSPYELDILKKAAGLSHTLFSRVRDLLAEGITEVELAGRLEAEYRRNGHQGFVRMRGFNQEIYYGHLLTGSNLGVPSFLDSPTGGPGLNPSFPQSAGVKKISRNEPVMVDYVAVYGGYMVDQARVFCLGRLDHRLVKAYGIAVEIQEAIKSSARPGVPCEELYALAVDIASRHGLQDHFMGYPHPAPFVGHGVGIELDELPVLARGFKTPLEKGMVIALEPKFVFPDGGAGIENTYVVGEKGLEALTTFDEGILYL